MKPFLMEFLKQLEIAIKPPAHTHHAITYARYGSDEEGWEDKLALQVNCNGVFVCLFLEEEDFNQTIDGLIADVLFQLKRPGEFQHGVGFAQYGDRTPEITSLALEVWGDQEKADGFLVSVSEESDGKVLTRLRSIQHGLPA